jgi:hypothetical protein
MHIVRYWMRSDGRCRQADSCTENVLAELYGINYDTSFLVWLLVSGMHNMGIYTLKALLLAYVCFCYYYYYYYSYYYYYYV